MVFPKYEKIKFTEFLWNLAPQTLLIARIFCSKLKSKLKANTDGLLSKILTQLKYLIIFKICCTLIDILS